MRVNQRIFWKRTKIARCICNGQPAMFDYSDHYDPSKRGLWVICLACDRRIGPYRIVKVALSNWSTEVKTTGGQDKI